MLTGVWFGCFREKGTGSLMLVRTRKTIEKVKTEGHRLLGEERLKNWRWAEAWAERLEEEDDRRGVVDAGGREAR